MEQKVSRLLTWDSSLTFKYAHRTLESYRSYIHIAKLTGLFSIRQCFYTSSKIPIGMANIRSMLLLGLVALVGIGMAIAVVPVTTEVLAQDNMTDMGNMTGNMTTDMGNMTDMGSGNTSTLLGTP